MPTRTLPLLRLSVALCGLLVASAIFFASNQSAEAQTAASLSIVISPEIPAGSNAGSLPINSGQRIVVQVTNTGAATLTNQQFVLRLAQKPDLIASVNDGAGTVGLVDPISGAWYHTIAQLPPATTLTYSVSAFKVCPGRWPIAARVGDKVSVTFATWVGQADARCLADENASPAASSYYALPWPPSGGLPVVPPASSTTVPGQISPSSTPASAALGVTTTGPRPTLINLTLGSTSTTPAQITSTTSSSTTTTVVAGQPVAKSTTTLRPGAVTTTTIIFCKTVGGKRYCAPKYSVYKDGQKKVVETKSTKKTTKKKTKK